MNKKIAEGVEILLKLGSLKKGEKVCIVTDEKTKDIGELFKEQTKKEGAGPIHFTIRALQMHGEEPPQEVVDCMKKSDLILGLTTSSMAHTLARKVSGELGARYLSLPEYSMELLTHPSLRIDFKRSAAKAKDLANSFTHGEKVKVTTKAGTDVELYIKGRVGNFCPGYVTDELKLGSPPDIEANVSPVEYRSNGVIVVDGSIPMEGLGKLSSPVTLEVKNGAIISIRGEGSVVTFLEKLFDQYGPKARVLAECGVGFNEGAKLCGNMLIDEGCYGTFHFGFGSNFTVGGTNRVNFHLDFVLYANTIELDGKKQRI